MKNLAKRPWPFLGLPQSRTVSELGLLISGDYCFWGCFRSGLWLFQTWDSLSSRNMSFFLVLHKCRLIRFWSNLRPWDLGHLGQHTSGAASDPGLSQNWGFLFLGLFISGAYYFWSFLFLELLISGASYFWGILFLGLLISGASYFWSFLFLGLLISEASNYFWGFL